MIALLSCVVALASYRYLLGFGPVLTDNRHSSPWLVLHATSAATALLLGPI